MSTLLRTLRRQQERDRERYEPTDDPDTVTVSIQELIDVLPAVVTAGAAMAGLHRAVLRLEQATRAFSALWLESETQRRRAMDRERGGAGIGRTAPFWR